jgi:UDP-N-acetylmuramate: L-alanyl-gamma-D-glutamyl-meso-diaminopimelate ligase
MHIHILGICGTFMAGIAVLAKQQGHHVTGSDENVYPPMSTQLSEQGIILKTGYEVSHLSPAPDLVIIGNGIKRGNPIVEYLLNENLPFISAPQWLYENILQNRWVLAVSGTHGKTTTSSMLAWILHQSKINTGFLIGGIPQNFGISARLGEKFFVIEADEYDTAFFDKRSKFIHYHPRTLIINNLEFDHADIFSNLSAIQKQFHHLVRTIPSNGLIICPQENKNIEEVLAQGCWTPTEKTGIHQGDWQARDISSDGSAFSIFHQDTFCGKLNWNLLGRHNVENALCAIAAAYHVKIKPEIAIEALSEFQSVKRRLENRGTVNGITIYDDFAHHPTAISTTLEGLRKRVGKERIIAVLELGSYTMRTGVHREALIPALQKADFIYFAKPKGEDWGVAKIAEQISERALVCENVEKIIQHLSQKLENRDHVLIMSNSGFDNIHEKLLSELKNEKKARS